MDVIKPRVRDYIKDIIDKIGTLCPKMYYIRALKYSFERDETDNNKDFFSNYTFPVIYENKNLGYRNIDLFVKFYEYKDDTRNVSIFVEMLDYYVDVNMYIMQFQKTTKSITSSAIAVFIKKGTDDYWIFTNETKL